ncbi:MAG: transferase [Erythrobacter sp.]
MNNTGAPLIELFISDWSASAFGASACVPWEATSYAQKLILDRIEQLDSSYRIENQVAVHRSATVEPSAILKGPVVVEPGAFVAANCYLRGGVFVARDCIVGPSCELKSTFMFSGSKIAHLSFVGDSIIGSRANIEAGATIANYRNECEDKAIRINWSGSILETGVEKFGAVIGDDAKIGANAVVAPGALLNRHTIVPRLGLIDQSPVALE